MVQLLRADDDKAVEAVLKDARGLDAWQRPGVLQCLESMQNAARSEFPDAVAHLGGLIKAWTRKFGTKHPAEKGRIPELGRVGDRYRV